MAERAPVAVVIPVFNRRLRLIKTLESVAGQTKPPSLLIVVDDGSTDGTAEAAEQWLARCDATFDWQVIRQSNCGPSGARNAGFDRIGKLPFICVLDSDDQWPPDFIAEGLRAFAVHEDAIAAVTDRVAERNRKRRPVHNLKSLVTNPLLWLICNDGGILSCLIIRSEAARAAGLFVPGMSASEDTDFLLRLFQEGGAVRSEAAPVLFIKKAPLESTEPPNLGRESPDAKYQWAVHLTEAMQTLPKPFVKRHDRLIRTALARRWADSAFASRREQRARSLSCLVHALKWDPNWLRKVRVVGAYVAGTRKIPHYFPTPFGSDGAVED
jgi:glycosyltransferase involved in cell wall biosynthesis